MRVPQIIQYIYRKTHSADTNIQSSLCYPFAPAQANKQGSAHCFGGHLVLKVYKLSSSLQPFRHKKKKVEVEKRKGISVLLHRAT